MINTTENSYQNLSDAEYANLIKELLSSTNPKQDLIEQIRKLNESVIIAIDPKSINLAELNGLDEEIKLPKLKTIITTNLENNKTKLENQQGLNIEKLKEEIKRQENTLERINKEEAIIDYTRKLINFRDSLSKEDMIQPAKLSLIDKIGKLISSFLEILKLSKGGKDDKELVKKIESTALQLKAMNDLPKALKEGNTNLHSDIKESRAADISSVLTNLIVKLATEGNKLVDNLKFNYNKKEQTFRTNFFNEVLNKAPISGWVDKVDSISIDSQEKTRS